ncbi:uncharacterized protein LOC115622041 [Scaptodrosophila lebanonensis]|uniref:Uncharacterized protein LOC115622041 n=1 Tax=Drosophila lebanonensis TaxID=7225 RepID=A0A6J2T6Y8_DROLE|nr:uncharacterized protein LOC115622041 [Scaptodrosophila lebanonensis]
MICGNVSRVGSAVLLLLLWRGTLVASVPALESAPPAATPNSIEEMNKLPDSNGDSSLTQATVANETSQREPQEQSVPDNVVTGSSLEPSSIYASGLITPEAFQQYLHQYGAAAGYAPYAGAYPAPIANAPGIYPYPGPIVVQTGYEGYLVPATVAAAGEVSGTSAVSSTSTPSTNPLMAFISKLLPTILMSTLFRIAAVILSAVGIIIFGGAITNAVCRLTPICDFQSKAVDYLRSGGAEDVGRMLAEEMTPERVRRATEFVRNAIRKYRQLQKLAESHDEKAD